MKKVNLFISCSTKSNVLTKQKKEITDLCNNLNIEYSQNRHSVNVSAVGYDDPEQRTKVFDFFLQRNANIVLFLVDKDNNEKQKNILFDELRRACKSYRDNRCPEILVYLPNDVEESVRKEIQDILKKNGLSINTLDDNSLVNNVEDNIRKYINSYNILHNIHFWAKFKYWASYLLFPVLGAAVLFFILYSTEKQKRLLLAGGGSAYNLIKEEYLGGDDSKIKKDRFIIYAPIPSGNAYGLLSEESEMDVDNEQRSFYTIVLSAGKANDNSFLRSSIMDYRKTGVVMGIHIGYDPLAIYHSFPITSTIDSSYMNSIIHKTIIPVYTTNRNSGTLKAYIDNNIIDSTFKPEHIFYSTRTIPDTNWIALGSNYYHPQNDSVYSLIMKDIPPKPVYIYFMRYKNKKNGKYELPSKVKDYLKTIGIRKSFIEDTIEVYDVSDTTRILFDDFETQGKYKK